MLPLPAVYKIILTQNTKQKNPILFTVVPTKEYYKLKAGINEIDKDAFFTAVDAYEVLGGE